MGSGVDTQLSRVHLSDDEAYLQATELVSLSVPTMLLKVAFELDLLEIIRKAGPEGTMSAAEIASHLPTTNPDAPVMLDKVLSVLVTYSVVSCCLETLADGKVRRRYGLGPVSKYLVKDKDGVSLAAIDLFVQSKIVMEIWYSMKDAILEGGHPWKKAHKEHMFELYSKDPEADRIFNKAMHDNTKIVVTKLLENYRGFDKISSLVDVGGGLGSSLNMIISKYPHIKGINFDQPHVIANAPAYPGKNIEHVGGDMFESIPKADAMYMKGIFHDWSDEHSLKLLKKCHEALPENGKVIVLECLRSQVPEDNLESRAVFMFDAMMMTHTVGGKERTHQEWQELAKNAGFQGVQVACPVYCFRAIEILKTC